MQWSTRWRHSEHISNTNASKFCFLFSLIHFCWTTFMAVAGLKYLFLNPRENISSHLIDRIWPLVLSWDGPVMLLCHRDRSAWVWVFRLPWLKMLVAVLDHLSNPLNKWWREGSTPSKLSNKQPLHFFRAEMHYKVDYQYSPCVLYIQWPTSHHLKIF